jgi:prevent-host-death family protein
MSEMVGVRELRQNLSRHLDQVKAGKRLIVTERNRPVAQLVPLGGDLTGIDRLAAEGRVVPASRPLDVKPVKLRGAATPGSDALDYVRGERD